MKTETFHINIYSLVDASQLLKNINRPCLEECMHLTLPCSENTLSDCQNSFMESAQRRAKSALLASNTSFVIQLDS